MRIASCSVLIGLFSLGCSQQGTTDPGASTGSSAKPTTSAEAQVSAAPSAPAEPPPKPKPTRPEKPVNVLLLTVDSLRADMPWAGYERDIAPNLTALTKEAVVYDDYRSVTSYTAQSVTCMLSGKLASTLYRDGWFFTGYRESNDFIQESMQKQGIRTMGVQAHMYFGRGKGIDQGFDVWELVPGITFDAQTDNHVTSEKSTKKIIEALSNPENTKGQWFLWSHYMDPHDQYIKHKESPDFGNSNRDRYDSEVWYTDYWLGELFKWGKTQPWWDNTAIIVTADHGEAFGEHKMWKHAFEVWDVLLKVPLIIKAPGAEPRRISERRNHLDIAPTIVDLMGVPPLEGFMGQSLVPEVYGAEPSKRETLLFELAEDSHNPPRRAIINGDYKLIVYGPGWKYMLFNLKEDPGETKDLAKVETEKLDEMKQLFDAEWAKVPSIKPYGGMKLKGGGTANGPMGPPKKAD
ncbi:MAG: sulfatase [Polyangiaceae bacterium]|nr:sulfatase [Polyangiaceae bacterium]MCW5789451.1 sulfatase [Polyangiaceae bacterium]